MALEFTENCNISLEGRDVYFNNDSPVNEKEWVELKKQLKLAYLPTAISFDFINQTFNTIKDRWSGMTLRTSREQFLIHCMLNNIQCIEDREKGVYVVKRFL